MSDLRPPLAAFSASMGTPATITPLGGPAVSAHVIWEGADMRQSIRSALLSGAGELIDLRPRLSIRKDLVPALPLGSQIEAADAPDGSARTWLVDEVNDTDPEFFSVVVH